MSETLYVCLTCDRHRTRPDGMPSGGLLLMQALAAVAQGLTERVHMRSVECLNGCPHPCNAAVRASCKSLMRLSRLTPRDAAAVLQLTQLYAARQDGIVAEDAIPAGLRAKVSQQRVHIPVSSGECCIRGN